MEQGYSSWVRIFKPQRDAVLRMFCFPYAGGGAQGFAKWPANLPESVELCALQLPGRETRMRELPLSSADSLVSAMMPALLPLMDKPFVLFGHSMGAIVAFELARRLEEVHGIVPECLIASARVAPHVAIPRPPINRLAQAEFIDGLKSMNGTPKEILEDEGLMALISPMLRADFAVHEEYVYSPGPPLLCDILAFGGLQDSEAGRAGVGAWSDYTAKKFALRMVPGGHFFIQSAQSLFLRMLSTELHQITTNLSVKENVADAERAYA